MNAWEKWKLVIQINMGSEGRERALKQIWDKYHQSLLWYIKSLCGVDNESAQDLLQDVMLKIYNHLESFDRRYAVSTWVYTITRNHCINQSLKKRPEIQQSDYSDIHSEDRNPEQKILIREQIADVEEFINGLPPEDREIAFLRFYQELPYKDISVLTNRSQGTLKYRVHAIRKSLNKYLEDKYEK